MSERLQLTAKERRELKEIWHALWLERGEGFNRATMEGEVADLWYEAVCTFLARRDNRFNDCNNTADNPDD